VIDGQLQVANKPLFGRAPGWGARVPLLVGAADSSAALPWGSGLPECAGWGRGEETQDVE
jgi:hypothetical protein